ncbi:SDR family NAD(P)-dependent oxidoreductase [Gordonia sp. DT218]|uniref:SDR family NAD(P)-dependent oxidoreductase n=1 Tax=Gordonia sp. DT218 TaxID=3416659 RepID=UPI003CEA517F
MSATDYDLTGKVALVTGGSRGLGRAMTQALAEAGADVVIASRKLDACEVAAAEVRESTGRRALPLAYHVGNWDDAQPTVDAVVEEFGRLDILINNAGMSPLYDGVETITEALWDKVFDVNLKGPFRLSIAAGEQMRTQGGGSIIGISSRASERPRPHTLPYASAKAGLNALTIALAHALGPEVRVNAIIAGTFLTDVSKSWDAEAFAKRAETFALGRGGDPAEITGAALYLASDASSYTTGSMLTVDGGQP